MEDIRKRELLDIIYPQLDEYWKIWVLKNKTCAEYLIIDKIIKYMDSKEK